MKQWETEQAAEVEKCVKFTQETCGCTLAHGNKPCSTLLPLGYYMDYWAQMFLEVPNWLTRGNKNFIHIG